MRWGADPIHLAVENAQNEDAFFISQKSSAEAIQIIKACELEAEELLRRNKLLLLKLAEYLTINSRMEEVKIEEYRKGVCEGSLGANGRIYKKGSLL